MAKKMKPIQAPVNAENLMEIFMACSMRREYLYISNSSPLKLFTVFTAVMACSAIPPAYSYSFIVC